MFAVGEMCMSVIPSVAAVFLFSLLIFFLVKFRKGPKGIHTMADLYEAEREANSARRREIDPSLYFTADLRQLPAMPADDKPAQKAAAHAAKTMVYFSEPISNITLKMTYGPGQLEKIAQYEENYQTFIRALLEWAESLAQNGNKKDALRVVEYTVAMGSEFKKSYILAVDLYAGEKDKLSALNETVQCRPFKDAQIKKIILHYIDDALRCLQ
jgi:hypothetical protein